MTAALSLTFRGAANAAETREIPVALVTITHPDFDAPIRLSSDPTTRLSTDPLAYGTTSRANFYAFTPMTLTLPTQTADDAPTAQLVLDNIDRALIPKLRGVTTPPQVMVELVLASTPDVVEATYPSFDLIQAQPTGETLTLNLSVDSQSAEPYPAGVFSPQGFPGLFA